MTDQPGQLAVREQRELRTLGRELRVGVSAEAQRHSDDIAVETDRSVEIADEQDRVAKTGRHASMFAPAAASNALSDELVAAPGHGQSNQKLVTVPLLNDGQSRLTLATLPRPQRDVEELARHRLQCCSGQPEKLRSPLGPLTPSCREPGVIAGIELELGRADERSGTLQNLRLRDRGAAARRAAATTLRARPG